jgi:predicted TPR repeat methyltransferase
MNKELQELFIQARKMHYENQLPQAIQLYEEVLKGNPNHQDSLHFLGLTYAQLGTMDKALACLTKANEIQPTASLLNNLANIYKKNKQFKQALQYYLNAIELEPNYAQAHNNIASIYAQQDNYQEALAHYVKAVHAEPDFIAAHFNLGLLLLKNNQLDAAKTQFNNVVSLDPNATQARFYLGVLYLENNELVEAERAFHEVLEHNSEQVQALVNLGVIALKRQQDQLAIDYFTRALALDNNELDARNNLASTFMHHDRFENALMHYDILLQKEPDNIEYLYNSGVAQMALGHLNEATLFFEKLLTLDEQHTPSLNNLAAIYLKQELRETSQAYLQKALDINPNDMISRHMINALTNAAESNTTPEYATNLFNNYALNYEQHMQGVLNYSVPKHVGRTLHDLKVLAVNKTLDLGCGTGLTGIVLRELSAHLTGVDIAEKMLKFAREKGIYDSLAHQELIAFLQEQHEQYNLIVAADVLPYFGDLTVLMRLINTHLSSGGYFIFTTELNESHSWKIESSARFSHAIDYIKELAEENQFLIVKSEKIPGRIQNQVPLTLMLYVLQK